MRFKETLRFARFNRHEIAGSLGDLGTFIPLLVGMASTNGLNFASSLFFSGLFNIVTGLIFSIPMAVQPMKAIAAIAITEGLTVPQILAAGIIVSAVILFLGLTGLIDWLNRAIPKSVVRGIQLALGLSLLIKGFQMIAGTKVAWGLDGYFTALIALLVVLIGVRFKNIPVALVLFIGGIILATLINPSVPKNIGIQISFPHPVHISWGDFVEAFPRAALPQIPLTLLNSVIAVTALSVDLFPDRRASPKKVSISVGVMNLVAAWFGGMPMCHGAGGMAGQYRFGARTNGSILFLGFVKVTIAILFGAALIGFCQIFPASILGVMLGFSGIGLALVTRDQVEPADAFVMLFTAGASIALNNMALAFVLGWILASGLRLKLFNVGS